MNKKTFIITYRNEFEIEVKAINRQEAIKKIQNNKGDISCVGDLWEEYMKIEEEGVDFDL